MESDPALSPPVVTPVSSAHVTRSLHPLSLVFEVAHLARTNLMPAIFASFSAASGGVVGAAIGFAVFGGAILISIFKYLTFRYTITDTNLLIDQGLIFRKHRSVPIERIQNIDSVQNLFHRFMGVAEVRIETASGNEPEAIMRVLTVAEVEQLRANLSIKGRSLVTPAVSVSDGPASQTETSAITPVGSAEVADELILRIPTKHLILAGLISNRGLVLASIALGYFWQATVRDRDFDGADKKFARSWIRNWLQSDRAEDWLGAAGSSATGILLAVLLLILAMFLLRALSAVWYILKFHGYQLRLRGDDLAIQCGLLTKVSATVPRERIQVVSVQRTWLARKFGLASVRVETLGGSGKQDEDASATVARRWFIPILAEEELSHVLKTLQPNLEWVSASTPWQPLSRFAFSRMIRLPLVICLLVTLIGVAMIFWVNTASGTVVTSLSVLGAVAVVVVCLRKSKSRRFARTPLGFIYRSGLLTQKTSFGFWDRVQDIDLIETPFDRRWNMAALRLDTAGAGVADHELLVEYLDAQVAVQEYQAALQVIND